MTITINRNRSLILAFEASNPTTQELGDKIARHLDANPAIASVSLDGDDAERAAGALYVRGFLSDNEASDYMSAPFV